MGKRGKIIAEIERQIGRLADQPGQCLYYAHHTATILWRHGLPAVIQAGSLQWPRVRREEDDGQIDTHFAYMWTPTDPESALSVALGNLPEIHVWVGILDRQEIVDFTTRHLRTGGRGPRDGLDCGQSASLRVVPGRRVARMGSLPAGP